MKIQEKVCTLFLNLLAWMFPMHAQLSLYQVNDDNYHDKKNTFPSIGKYLDKVDRVMTQVDRITEDIAHMPVAAFIFRDKESDEVHYSTDIRYLVQNQFKNRNKLY